MSLALHFESAGSGVKVVAKTAEAIEKHRVVAASGQLDGSVPTIKTAMPDDIGFALTLESSQIGWKTEILLHGIVQLDYDAGLGSLYLGSDGRLSSEGVGNKLAVGLPGRWVVFG